MTGNPIDRALVWKVVAATLIGLVLIITVWMAGMPKYRLWKASYEKKIQVEDALGRKLAAEQLAEAEVARARGVAEANKIISGSITEPYLRYFYIQQLSEVEAHGGRIIYVPTEAGLPILEAGRAVEGVTP